MVNSCLPSAIVPTRFDVGIPTTEARPAVGVGHVLSEREAFQRIALDAVLESILCAANQQQAAAHIGASPVVRHGVTEVGAVARIGTRSGIWPVEPAAAGREAKARVEDREHVFFATV